MLARIVMELGSCFGSSYTPTFEGCVKALQAPVESEEATQGNCHGRPGDCRPGETPVKVTGSPASAPSTPPAAKPKEGKCHGWPGDCEPGETPGQYNP